MVKEKRLYWVAHDQVCITDGKALALSDDLRSVCIGPEDVILEALETEKIPSTLSSYQRQLLIEIIQEEKVRKQEDIDRPPKKATWVKHPRKKKGASY